VFTPAKSYSYQLERASGNFFNNATVLNCSLFYFYFGGTCFSMMNEINISWNGCVILKGQKRKINEKTQARLHLAELTTAMFAFLLSSELSHLFSPVI
jgi:hypothetical protein